MIKEKMNKLVEKRWFPIILIAIFSILSCLFLFHKGIILGHDLEYHLSRIDSISKLIKNGDFLAIIHEGINDYGYANGLCYSNLFLYFPALLCLLGIKTVTSYKIFLFIVTYLTGLTMYYCTKKISNNKSAALLSSAIYLMCSYRICDIMVRAAVGEVLSFIFLPIIILGLYELIFGNSKKFYIFSIGFVGLINCHLISTVLMAMICFGIILLCYKEFFKDKKRFIHLIYSALLGLFLGAFFIFPLLEFYTKSDILIKSNSDEIVHYLNIYDVFSGIPKFTTRFTPPGIGFIFFYIVFCRFFIKTKKEKFFRFSDICLVFGFLCVLFSTNILPWAELSKIFGFVQFSWRLFLYASALLAFSSGIIFDSYIRNTEFEKIRRIIFYIFLIACCFVYQFLSLYSIKRYYNVDYVKYIYKLDSFSLAAGEYLPVKTDWSLLDTDIRKPKTSSNNIKVNFKDEGSVLYVDFKNNYNNDSYIDIPQIYYRGFSAKSTMTNKYYKVDYGYNTWIRIYIGDTKEDSLKIWYKGTRLHRLSIIVSIISWLVFIGFMIRNRKKA